MPISREKNPVIVKDATTGEIVKFSARLITHNSNYTFKLADIGAILIHDDNSSYTWTIPLKSTVDWPRGTLIRIAKNGGTGTLTIAKGSGVSLYLAGTNTDGNVTLAATNRWSVHIFMIANNVWLINDDNTTAGLGGGLLGDLATLGSSSADGEIIVATGAGALAWESGATARASLGLTIGTNVQAYDADLTTWAGITPGTGVGTALAVNVGTAGSFVVNGGVLGTPSSGTLTNCTGLPAAGVTGTALVAAAIGTTVQAWDTNLDQIAALAVTDSNIIVGNGSAWVAESGATARTSLGVGTGDSPQFTGLTLTGDLTLTLGDIIYSHTGFDIKASTSDGSDNSKATMAGGGAAASSRGALVTVYGNEHANTGQVLIQSGDVVGADIILAPKGVTALTLNDVDGNATFASTITASSGGSLTGTWTNLGTVTTVDVNGGTIDGTTIGGSSAGAVTGTTITASTKYLSAAGSGTAPAYGFSSNTDVGFVLNSEAALANATTIAVVIDNNLGTPSAVEIGKWSASDTDIDGLISGSTAGALILGPRTGSAGSHLTVALRDNDVNDGFQIISGGGDWVTDTTWDTKVFEAKASGSVIIHSDITIDTGSITSASGALSFGNENLSTTGYISTAHVINVRNHGATGLGVEDDTAELQAAFDAVPAAGAIVYIPSGTYKVATAANGTPTLTIKSNTTVMGDGWSSIIKFTGSHTNPRGISAGSTGYSKMAITNLMLDASAWTGTGGAHVVLFDTATFTAVKGCYIKTTGQAVSHVTCSQFWVTDNYCLATDDIGDGMIDQWSGSHDGHITGNTIDGASLCHYGILCTGTNTANDSSTPVYNMQISGNIINDVTLIGVWLEGRFVDSCYNCTVTNNIIDTVTSFHGIRLSAGYACTVSDNIIRTTELIGIANFGDFGAIPVTCATTANITLSGEQTIDGVLTSASTVLVKNQSTDSQNGVYVSAAGAWSRHTSMDTWAETLATANGTSGVISGTTNANTLWRSGTAAGGTLGVTSITYSAAGSTLASHDCIISNNIIEDVNQAADAGLDGVAIRLTSGADNNIVSGNRIEGTTHTRAMALDSGADGNYVYGNIADDGSAAAPNFYDVGSGNIIFNNKGMEVGTVTQGGSRTTGVTLDYVTGQITLVSAAGSASWQSFTVTNSTVASTDEVIVNQDSGTDLYLIHVTAVGAGSFKITYATTGGTTTEQPVFNFRVMKSMP